MAKKIDMLHQLVHSLNAAEKRHFKMSIGTGARQPNYLKLFAALDEAADLGDAFKKKTKGLANISYESDQLQHALLRTLREYHEDSTAGTQIIQALGSIEVLFAKQQYDMCESMVNEYLEIARKREKFTFVLELLSWQRRIAIRLANRNTIQATHAAINALEMEYLQKIENVIAYKEIQVRLMFLNGRKGIVQTQDELQEYHDFIKHPLLQNSETALSLEALNTFHNAWVRYYSDTIQLEKAFDAAVAAAEAYGSNEIAVRYNKQAYFVTLANVMNRAIQLEKFDVAHEMLSKIDGLRNIKGARGNDQVESDLLNVSVVYPMAINNLQRQYHKALEVYEQHKDIVHSRKYVFDEIFWRFYHLQIARAYFYTGNYGQALDFINKILNNIEQKQRYDLILCAQLFLIMIHYEIGNYKILPYLIKSAKRFAASNNFKQELLPHFFSMVTKLSTLQNDKDKEAIYNKYHAIFTSKELSTHDAAIIGSIDLDYWTIKEYRTLCE